VISASILIVDDNPINLRLLRTLLVAEGYVVRTAMDAEEALTVLEDFEPDLILMDLQLPGMDGLELTRRLKANPRTKDTLVLAVTAYAMKGDSQRVLSSGCDGYVAKPIDTRTLPALLASHLAGVKSRTRDDDADGE
jgi:CheY-like chemotaxis protein